MLKKEEQEKLDETRALQREVDEKKTRVDDLTKKLTVLKTKTDKKLEERTKEFEKEIKDLGDKIERDITNTINDIEHKKKELKQIREFEVRNCFYIFKGRKRSKRIGT